MSATISDCGRYRYDLTRQWGDERTLLWCMLNPSTADAEVDDPTIRRCVGFSRREGYGRLVVVNLFAFRATEPDELLRTTDPYGPLNSRTIGSHLADERVDRLVVAWGAWFRQHSKRLWLTRPRIEGILPTVCLGVTKTGAPRHPLYVKADEPFTAWPVAHIEAGAA